MRKIPQGQPPGTGVEFDLRATLDKYKQLGLIAILWQLSDGQYIAGPSGDITRQTAGGIPFQTQTLRPTLVAATLASSSITSPVRHKHGTVP
jgi:hypothetical protein